MKTPPSRHLESLAFLAAAALTALGCLSSEPPPPLAAQPAPVQEADPKTLYLRGYQFKDSSPDEARKLFQRVVELTAPSDEYHQKALFRLQQLDGR